MNSQEQQREVIAKFKRNGHQISKKALEKAMQFVRGNAFAKNLQSLVRKVNDIAISEPFLMKQDVIRKAILILCQTTSKFKSYDEVVEDLKRWCLCILSPYEIDQQNFFVERPTKELFQFLAGQKMQMQLKRFKRIANFNREVQKKNNIFLGVFYENYSSLSSNSKPKLLIQNQVNQVQVILPQHPECLLLPGCTYIVQGTYMSKDLILTVDSIQLPLPAGEEKNCLMKNKFSRICENISSSKTGLQFSSSDFVKYDAVFNEERDPTRPLIIIGNISINKNSVEKVIKIISALPSKVYAIVLMMAEDGHESIDLGVWFSGIKVFVIPHINSQGPRLLPKLPILKYKFNTKILTNPARICIDGWQLVLANYSLLTNIFHKTLNHEQLERTSNEILIGKAADLIFSQSSIAIQQNIYWRQNQYFNINGSTVVIVNDQSTHSYQHKLKQKEPKQKNDGKAQGLITTGSFERTGDFICFMPQLKNPIQFCQFPKQ